MKKLFLTFSLMVVAICSAWALSADEILGKWESNTVKHDPTPEMPMTVTEKYIFEFKADGSLNFKSDGSISIELQDGVFADMFPKVQGSGTYTVEGDSISVEVNTETVKVNFTEDDLRIRGLEDESMALQVHDGLYQQLAPGMQQMSESFTEPMVINNVMVTGNKMMGSMDDEFMTFKRKKK